VATLPPGRKIVVVSPHSDDVVLSLGAAIASWARRGAVVELLTVLALDPQSRAPAGGWDGRAGFRTEGEAATRRRDEDRRAGAILGATLSWLPFGSVDYERHGDEDDVRAAVVARTAGADAVLLPGAPLSHPDHAWLVRTLADAPLPGGVAVYAEQPYTRKTGLAPAAPSWLDDAFGGLAFERVASGPRARLAKWRAIRQYASQLPLLALERSLRRGPASLALTPELVAWASGRDRAAT
jgi:LmbE family N-acetylglucosaminyl deacetylase